MLSLAFRCIPFGIGLLVLAGLLAIVRVPTLLLSVSPVLVSVVAVAVWQLTQPRPLHPRFLRFLIIPTMLLLNGLLFLTFVEDAGIQRLIVVVLSVLTWLFLEMLHAYFYDRPRYQPHALENLSNHIAVLTVFFLVSGMLSLSVFLAVSPWITSVLVGATILLLTYEVFWASELPWVSSWKYIVGITWLCTQCFIVISFLPSSVYVGGVVVTAWYYVTIGVLRNWLVQIREGSVIRRYVSISTAIIALALLTAKWY